MAREHPGIQFERYCDDVVVHCRNEVQAHRVRQAIAERLAECGGLELHPQKTRIVYCKDRNRRGSAEHTSFTFLGYGFRVRRLRTKRGEYFFGFNPGVSDEAAKLIRVQIRRWRLHLRRLTFLSGGAVAAAVLAGLTAASVSVPVRARIGCGPVRLGPHRIFRRLEAAWISSPGGDAACS
jgi:hypothetical protein